MLLPKKNRVVRTTRSESREETPKEGMNRKILFNVKPIVHRTNVKRHDAVLHRE